MSAAYPNPTTTTPPLYRHSGQKRFLLYNPCRGMAGIRSQSGYVELVLAIFHGRWSEIEADYLSSSRARRQESPVEKVSELLLKPDKHGGPSGRVVYRAFVGYVLLVAECIYGRSVPEQ